MTGLDCIRQYVTEYLQERGLGAVCAWSEKARTRGKGPVVAVSLRRCEGGSAGFRDYLGERYNQETGQWEELYGRKIRVTLGLDLFSDTANGAEELDRAFDRLAEILGEGPEGVKLHTLSCGETQFDRESGRFFRAAEAVCEGYLYAVADGGGAFLDFAVKGSMKL